MARSLTVAQEENPTTTRLFNVFLIIAVLCLGAVAFGTSASDAGAAAPAAVDHP
jgi:hypothetical protein